jgi:hypothetical protein
MSGSSDVTNSYVALRRACGTVQELVCAVHVTRPNPTEPIELLTSRPGWTTTGQTRDQSCGERHYRVRDLAGHQWTCTGSVADIAPGRPGRRTHLSW